MGLTPDELIIEWQENYDYILLFDVDTGSNTDGYSLWSRLHDFALEENEIFPQYFFPNVSEIWSDDIAYTLYTWDE